jgi:phospholipid N-methyltransferase
MNTYSHVLGTWAAARRVDPNHAPSAWMAAAGAALPDVPYLARALSFLVRERRNLSFRDVLEHLDYFGAPRWPPDLLLHSLLPIAPAAALARVMPAGRARADLMWLASGWAAHNAVDLLTHATDARPHLWPVSRRRWRSPISYWDRKSHALPMIAAEHACVLALLVHIVRGARRGRRRRDHATVSRAALPGPCAREVMGLAAAFARNPRQVGALIPTSQSTVRAMLNMADLSHVRCVVELGAGTGVYTAELLRRLGPDTTVFAFEIDRALADGLSGRFADQRLRVINDSAERVADYLDGKMADLIVSALPFTSLPSAQRAAVYAAILRVLDPHGVMLAIQYSTARQRDFERMFSSVRRRRSVRNVPPALMYAGRGPAPTQLLSQ